MSSKSTNKPPTPPFYTSPQSNRSRLSIQVLSAHAQALTAHANALTAHALALSAHAMTSAAGSVALGLKITPDNSILGYTVQVGTGPGCLVLGPHNFGSDGSYKCDASPYVQNGQLTIALAVANTPASVLTTCDVTINTVPQQQLAAVAPAAYDARTYPVY